MTLVSHNIVEGFWPWPRTSQHANWRSADLPSSGWPALPPETDDKIFYNYKLQFWETLNMIFSLTIKKNLQSHLVHQLVIKNVPATMFHNQLSFVGMKGSLLICCFRFQHDDSAVCFTRLSHILPKKLSEVTS